MLRERLCPGTKVTLLAILAQIIRMRLQYKRALIVGTSLMNILLAVREKYGKGVLDWVTKIKNISCPNQGG